MLDNTFAILALTLFNAERIQVDGLILEYGKRRFEECVPASQSVVSEVREHPTGQGQEQKMRVKMLQDWPILRLGNVLCCNLVLLISTPS